MDKIEYSDSDIKFWIEEEAENGSSLKIDTTALLDFLYQKGFRKHYLDNNNSIFLQVENKIIHEVSIEQIKDFVQTYINKAPINLTNKSNNNNIRRALIKFNNQCFSKNNLQFLQPIKLYLNSDTLDTAYFYFRNGFVKVTTDDITFYEYKELNHYIWKDQIIDKFFYITNIKSDFESFIKNICRQDESRYSALISSIGYLLHSYKDPTVTKAIIYCDEKLSKSGEAKGRTGKSRIGEAIAHLKKSTRIDGKDFKFNKNFTYQEVNLDTQIINFNDVRLSFDFESLFSVLTEGITVEKKGKKPFNIPYKNSPKILISTNYTIQGFGDSFEDRMFEVEFSDHYNINHTPVDDFGKRFWDDWDEKEWNSFFSFLINCTQFYLKTGLVKYRHINLERKKLEQITSAEFCAFADKIERNVEFDKAELFANFIEENPHIPYMQRTFNSYLIKYCQNYNIYLKERKSAGKIFIILKLSD